MRGLTASALLVVVAGAGACTSDDPDGGSKGEDRVPATWTIPDDACTRLDLVGIVRNVVGRPQQPPRAGTEDVEDDRAGCTAGAGSGFQLSVELRTTTDAGDHADDWEDAQARLEPPATWSSLGRVETLDAAPDPATWAARSGAAAHEVVVLSSSDERADARYLTQTLVADDDDLVVVVTVVSGGPRTRGEVRDQTRAAARAVAAAVEAVPKTLEE